MHLQRRHDEISSSEPESRGASIQAEASTSSSTSSAFSGRSFDSYSPPRQPAFPRYDYRRPVMSTGVPPPPPSFQPQQHASNVIDLTEDDPNSPPRREPHTPHAQANGATRPPRFGRNIMADVVDLDQEPTPSTNNDPQSSPEVQWLGSYPRAGPSTAQDTQAAPSYHDRHRSLRGSNLLNLLSAENYRIPPSTLNRADVFREEMALRTRHLVGAFQQAMSPFWLGHPPRDAVDLDDPDMDVIQAFGPVPARRGPVTPAAPAYEAPPVPEEGFTGSTAEDDVVVCPNCDHELGTGDNPEQKQVWVARHCGHVHLPVSLVSSLGRLLLTVSCYYPQVYCGLCTKNRAARGKKAATTKTKYFSKCVVSDCGKSVSQPKSMLQIYL